MPAPTPIAFRFSPSGKISAGPEGIENAWQSLMSPTPGVAHIGSSPPGRMLIRQLAGLPA